MQQIIMSRNAQKNICITSPQTYECVLSGVKQLLEKLNRICLDCVWPLGGDGRPHREQHFELNKLC